VKGMSELWDAWAKRVGVAPWPAGKGAAKRTAD